MVESRRPPANWPSAGEVDIKNLTLKVGDLFGCCACSSAAAAACFSMLTNLMFFVFFLNVLEVFVAVVFCVFFFGVICFLRGNLLSGCRCS